MIRLHTVPSLSAGTLTDQWESLVQERGLDPRVHRKNDKSRGAATAEEVHSLVVVGQRFVLATPTLCGRFVLHVQSGRSLI